MDPEREIIERMTKFVVNFVTFGNPTPLTDDTEYTEGTGIWKESSSNQEYYLNIGNDGDFLKQGLFKERYKIWDDLFPLKEFNEKLDT